ncbi:MAG: prephenate dehydrogenase [Thermoleophilia bacterium]
MDTPARIGVVGAGLIGGSIIKAAAQAGPGSGPRPVVVCDRDPATRDQLADAGFAVVETPADLAPRVEVAIAAVPPAVTPRVVAELLGASDTLIVSDAASVKESVWNSVAARVSAAELARFVPGHPLAGRESRGWAHADPGVLAGAMWALCPAEGRTDPGAAVRVIDAITHVMGARVLLLAARDHDVVLAHTSHMPHVAASALMTAVIRDAPALRMRLSGGALRDTTRVAAANPDLWTEILRDNGPNVAAALDALIGDLGRLRDIVRDERWDDLAVAWREGARARETLDRVRWSGHTRSVEVDCEPSVEALLDIGSGGALILRVIRTSPRLTLELSRD